MAWLEDEQSASDRFLKIDSPKKKGESTKVTIRVLDAEPEGTFRHWFNRRPYNCPGRAGKCPVCVVRNAAIEMDKDAAKKQYQMEHVYFFNVLVDGEVKILTFKNAVATKLREFIHEYGDLRNYDVKITKTKNGPLDMNIAWDVLYVGPRELTEDEQTAISEDLHNLKQEVVPASYEDLEKVAKGEIPSNENEDGEGREESGSAEDEGRTRQQESLGRNYLNEEGKRVFESYAPQERSEMLDKFEAIVNQKGKSLSDYGVDPSNPPSDRILKAMIKQLED